MFRFAQTELGMAAYECDPVYGTCGGGFGGGDAPGFGWAVQGVPLFTGYKGEPPVSTGPPDDTTQSATAEPLPPLTATVQNGQVVISHDPVTVSNPVNQTVAQTTATSGNNKAILVGAGIVALLIVASGAK